MKNVSLILSSVAILAMLFSSCNENTEYGEATTPKETTSTSVSESDNSIKSVTIGNQIWMSKNLNVEKFRNGDPIPHAKTFQEWMKANNNEEPAWCFYNNDPSNGEKYGKLYNWYAANDPRGLSPVGWHIPSDAEWTSLTDYLGGKEVAGTKMKSITGWKDSSNGTNESGFTGIPGGFRTSTSYFSLIGIYGIWLSSTEYRAGHAWSCHLHYEDGIKMVATKKGDGLSVRCLRD